MIKDSSIRKRVILLLVCVIVTLAIAAKMISGFWVQKRADEAYKAMRQKSVEVKKTEAVVAESQAAETAVGAGNTEVIKQPDFAELQKENPDIYAWISIPDTNIDYPVVQHATDNTYYLEHNLDGSKGYPGCVYSEKENRKDFADFQTVLYGHNMRNGTMFHDLKYFLEDEFLSQHPYIYIYTETATYQYEIFAAYEYDDEHLLHAFSYDRQEDVQRYADEIAKYNANGEELMLSIESNILTLSTCISDKDDKRLLVQGILLE